MAVGHQSPQSNLSPLAYKVINTTTWGNGGNTCTITDQYVKSNSTPLIYVTGTTPAAGRWSWTVTDSTIVITSSDSEDPSLPLSYIVL